MLDPKVRVVRTLARRDWSGADQRRYPAFIAGMWP